MFFHERSFKLINLCRSLRYGFGQIKHVSAIKGF
jgi:hypothetical protein